MKPTYDDLMRSTRRHFLGKVGLGLGSLAMAKMLGSEARAAAQSGVLDALHHAPKAKRVIYLFQAGGPSHLETFDFKPVLRAGHGKALPKDVIGNQRLSTMSGNQSLLPMAGSFANFTKSGRCGMEICDTLPYTQKIADDICLIRTMHTEAINHDPAITFFCSGNQVPGRPSMGAWASYGLGTLNDNLPAFIVLVSKNASRDQPLYSRLWGAGFLPSEHQGVQFRAGKEPVLYLTNPEGVSPHVRRDMLDALLLHPALIVRERRTRNELQSQRGLSDGFGEGNGRLGDGVGRKSSEEVAFRARDENETLYQRESLRTLQPGRVPEIAEGLRTMIRQRGRCDLPGRPTIRQRLIDRNGRNDFAAATSVKQSARLPE